MKNLHFVLLIIITALGFYIMYFAYKKYGKTHNQVIVLSEDKEEYKKRPIDRGGIIIPNSNILIYEKLNSKNKKENKINLLPDSEEPITLLFKNHNENISDYDSIDEILAKIDLDTEKEIENQKEQEINILAEQEINEVNKKSEENFQLKIIRLSEENNKLHKLSINSTDSSYKIQLSSAASEKEALNEWKRIQSRHMKYLKNAKPIIKKVNVNNEKIICLVMAGNYSSPDQAKLICKKLILSKQNCIVTK